MRIVIADYSGHPFQVQLSRELARIGHSVLHLHFVEFQTPKGRLQLGPDDPPTLKIEPISLGRTFAKHNYWRRVFQEIEVGRRFSRAVEAFSPDVVVGSNLPLDTLQMITRCCKAAKRPFVFWQQDIYSIAVAQILTSKFGVIGRLIGKHYKRIEKSVLQSSAAVVVVSEDFVPRLYSEFGVSGEHIHVIRNWAPIDEITPQAKDNPWSRAQGLADKDVVLYTGTLGMKHDPGKLLALAVALGSRQNLAIVVASEGPAVDWLVTHARKKGVTCLRIIGFQPFDVYSQVLATANVLVAILEADSGVFSVPSKVLSYLCAGRPIVLSAPPENLASRIIVEAGAGKCVPAGDSNGLTSAVGELLSDKGLSVRAGTNGRAYAQACFDIREICGRFERILKDVRIGTRGEQA